MTAMLGAIAVALSISSCAASTTQTGPPIISVTAKAASGGGSRTLGGSGSGSGSATACPTVVENGVTVTEACELSASPTQDHGVILPPTESASLQPCLAPVVTSVSPSSGSAGDAATIYGAGFTGEPQVYFGTAAAAPPTLDSSTAISVVVPPGPASGGAVAVTVTPSCGGTGSTATPAVEFTYEPSTSSPFQTAPSGPGGSPAALAPSPSP